MTLKQLQDASKIMSKGICAESFLILPSGTERNIPHKVTALFHTIRSIKGESTQMNTYYKMVTLPDTK